VESNHVIPRYQRGAVTVWLTPFVFMAVVSGVFEPPPAGFQPTAPPSELRDHWLFTTGAGGGDRTRSLSLTRRAPLPSGPRRHGVAVCAMDAREGLSPSCRGLQPRASILGHRAVAAREGLEPPPSG
jgi:hypothetical protein